MWARVGGQLPQMFSPSTDLNHYRNNPFLSLFLSLSRFTLSILIASLPSINHKSTYLSCLFSLLAMSQKFSSRKRTSYVSKSSPVSLGLASPPSHSSRHLQRCSCQSIGKLDERNSVSTCAKILSPSFKRLNWKV